jgi:hypothetical protein
MQAAITEHVGTASRFFAECAVLADGVALGHLSGYRHRINQFLR